ncbi:MAG: YhjD/YihY/BrkB family envelope integrity protein, partial [Limisphaerales bacterium]
MDPKPASLLRRLTGHARSLADGFDTAAVEAAPRTRLHDFLQFFLLAGQSFARNRCPVRASALAYSSLLAFIPLLAVVLGISTSVLKGDADRLRGWIDDAIVQVAPQLKDSAEFGGTLDTFMEKVDEMIARVHSGTLGTTGMLALLAIILFMLARIEETFNDIWGVARGRSWPARVLNYWGAITLGPILAVTALGLTTSLNLRATQDFVGQLPILGTTLLKLLPVPLLAITCGLFYFMMPNTKVKWQAALVGGLVAGLLWHLNNTLGVLFVSQATRNSAIYGSLGIIPIFMVGLYFFWMLLLFGAQVAYTYQHRHGYLLARRAGRVHQQGRELVALRLLATAGLAFAQGRPAPTLGRLAAGLGLPAPLLAPLLETLVKNRLLTEAAGPETGYLPARPLAAITVGDVLHALRVGLGEAVTGGDGPDREAVLAALEAVAAAESVAGREVTL